MINQTKIWYCIKLAKDGRDDKAIAKAAGLTLPEIDKVLREAGLR